MFLDKIHKLKCKFSQFYDLFSYLCYFWEGGYLGDQGVDGRIISGKIFRI
jgi:hypothetical protein